MQSLECPVCFETYDAQERIPKLLNCGHTLCQKCLIEIYARNQKIICTLDQSIFENQPQDFPTVFIVLELIESQTKNNQQKENQKEPRCQAHENRCKFYCKTDKQQICFKCLQKCHEEHEVLQIKEMLDELKPKENQVNQKIAIQTQNIYIQRYEAEKQYEQLNNFIQQSIQTLEQTKNQIIEQIEVIFNQRLSQIQQATEKYKKQFQGQINKLNNEIKIFQEFQEYQKSDINLYIQKMDQIEKQIKKQIKINNLEMDLTFDLDLNQINTIKQTVQEMILIDIDIGEQLTPKETLEIHRNGNLTKSWGYNGEYYNCITFVSNKKCKIIGIGLFIPFSRGRQLTVKSLQLLKGQSTQAQKIYKYLGDIKMENNGDENKIQEVKFKEKVNIERDQFYTLKVLIIGADSYYMNNYKTEITNKDLKVNFYDSKFEGCDKSNSTSTKRGQIPIIYFEV